MNEKELLQQLADEMDAFPSWDPVQLNADGTLVLTIDMNKGFTQSGALSSPRVKAILPRMREFLETCREKGLYMAAVTDCHTPESLELASYPVHCLDDSDEPELAPEIWEFQQKVLIKNSTNAFFAPGMDRLLEGVSTVVLVGCCTDICIEQFALTLKAWANQADSPLNVIVPRQLVETYDAPGHPAELWNGLALHTLAANGVSVVNYLPAK
ncbi:MAG TPA: cysteine hydrolase [Candidatus Merdivicinus intestinavium]|nr:cysteine hydrolase [Candidatus Merdivicinus intestinavium]